MRKKNNIKQRRSALAVMGSLIGLIKPLLHIMLAAILLGTAGYLCAIFLTILAGQTVILGMQMGTEKICVSGAGADWQMFSIRTWFLIMAGLAVMRGVLHYAEQYCNHFIAFKLLAIIRHKVFAALRKLCPAKLEGRDKGNLISIITTDIELLEVFYAHTISPIAIAVLTSIVMTLFIGQYNIKAGIFALAAYSMVGILIPMWNGHRGAKHGMEFRTLFGELNSFVLDSLRGLDETIQYGQGTKRESQMENRSENLARLQKKLSQIEGTQRSVTNLTILLASFGMLFLTLHLYHLGVLPFDGVLTCTIALMGSFGPVVALSGLSNNLNQTLASGERVLSLLEEKPMVEEIAGEGESSVTFTGAKAEHVSFTYREQRQREGQEDYMTESEEQILKDYSLKFEPGKINGIHGTSGSGKSTLLKLLMRFWDVNAGSVSVNNRDVREIPTRQLCNMESYVTQETHLFHDTIARNIAVAKINATHEEIIEAAKKASIHEFIQSLPEGYDTKVGELGDTLSGGEKQRIGIARAFLHDAPLMLLDEPTSNLDSLNEGIILKALKESAKKKTIVLVSHRKSTMNVADFVYEMVNGRIS